MTRPRIALIATGGTIDSVGADRLDIAHYTETTRRLGEGELVASLPELADIADVVDVPFRRVPSYALSTHDWATLAATVTDLIIADDYDAVVITHGTNTIEETAFALSLTVDVGAPVVLTGAMRPASAIGADGPLNLVRAVQVAAAPESRDRGPLVVLDDTIHSARHVTKTATFRVSTFRSPGAGPVGHADADGTVVFHHGPRRGGRPHFAPSALQALPRVDVVVSHVGADGTLIDAAVAAGARGLVSAGTGAGRPTAAEDEAINRALATGVVICQTSRTGSGRVARSPRMTERGVVTGNDLRPWNARILLALGLTDTANPDQIQDLFDRA